MILENTFVSMSHMVDAVMPKLAPLKSFILRNYWPSISRIRSVHAPLFFISGAKDELVPPFHMHLLKEGARSAAFVDFFEVPLGDHNTTWKVAGPAYEDRIRSFIDRALSNLR